jgi:aryl-alcohol dehydrogenase-like predicted oxidoreductase
MSGSYGPADEGESPARTSPAPRPAAPLEEVAQAHGAKSSHVTLAWVLFREDRVVPIPGLKRRAHLEENVAAMDIRLTPDDLARLDAALPPGIAAGDRHNPEQARWVGR